VSEYVMSNKSFSRNTMLTCSNAEEDTFFLRNFRAFCKIFWFFIYPSSATNETSRSDTRSVTGTFITFTFV